MSLLVNRARMTTATTGTGALTLGLALAGYLSLNEAGVPNGATVTYCIEDSSNFEIGRGVYNSSGQTLTRGAIIVSKINGQAADTSPISLSGSATVYLTGAAEDLLSRNAAIGDDAIVRGDGGAGGVQSSGVTIDDSGNIAWPGYHDFAEITAPASPGANIARLYAFDDGGVTRLGIKDAAGAVTAIGSGLFLPASTPINWNAGDVAITHAANALTFAGASSGYSFDASLLLGPTTAINWNGGDVTITHSANALAFAGASSGYSFDAQVTALSFAITNVAPILIAGPTTATAAATMATEWLWGESSARTALTAEGAIWAGAVHNGVGIAKIFTSAHNQAVANTGPAAGLFVYARNNACNADVVGVLADAHAVTANQTVFGANIIARNDVVNGVKIVGCEIDVEFAAGSTAGAGSGGLLINVFNVAVPGPAILLGALGGGTFQNGLVIHGLASNGAGVSPNGATTMGSLLNSGAATFNDAAVVLSNTHRTRFNGTAAAHAYIYNDNANNLRIVGGSAGTVLRNNGDTNSNLTIADNGDVTGIGFIKSSSATAGIGYATGAGGTVVQATNRTTGVTLNKVCGSITMVTAAGSATPATFIVTNSAVAQNDRIILNYGSATNVYHFIVSATANGSFAITFFTTGGTASDTPIIGFTVIKSVSS